MTQFEFDPDVWGAQAELQGFLADKGLAPFSDFTVECDSGNAEIKAVLKIENDATICGFMKEFAKTSNFGRLFYNDEKNAYTFKKTL